MTWQPIETAPRDGTLVLVFAGDRGAEVARWGAPYDSRDLSSYIWIVAGYAPVSLSEDDVTHWMPLPAPPTPTPTE